MTLPTMQLPTYEVRLPSTGEEIKIRPFVVREEKVLLMAAESDDENEIINATKQTIKNCIVEGNVNVDTLPFFDVDYLFTALRAKSIGEKIETLFTCNNTIENDAVCGHTFYADIDISNVEIRNRDNDKNVDLGKNFTLKMRYPTYSAIRAIQNSSNNLDAKIKIMAGCIDMIVQGDKVYSWKDYSREELIQFIEGLTQEQFKKIETFVDNFPSFFVGVTHACGKCGFVHYLEYDDFTDFFQ